MGRNKYRVTNVSCNSSKDTPTPINNEYWEITFKRGSKATNSWVDVRFADGPKDYVRGSWMSENTWGADNWYVVFESYGFVFVRDQTHDLCYYTLVKE